MGHWEEAIAEVLDFWTERIEELVQQESGAKPLTGAVRREAYEAVLSSPDLAAAREEFEARYPGEYDRMTARRLAEARKEEEGMEL